MCACVWCLFVGGGGEEDGPVLQSALQQAALRSVQYNISYVYHSMAAYFDRDTVALPGLAEHFRRCSLEEREHAQARTAGGQRCRSEEGGGWSGGS